MIKTAAIAAGLLAGLCLAGGQAAADGLSKVFEAREVKVLELRGLPGKIEILPSADGRIHLDLSGDSESVKRFKAESRDGRLVVTGPMVTVTGSSTTVTASHGSVTNVVIGSGQATVNVGGGAVQAVSGDVQTRILAPPGLELKASFTGTMVTDLAFASIDLEASGDCSATMPGVKAGRARLDASGSCRVKIDGLDRAEIVVDAAGSCEIALAGSFREVSIDSAGDCRVSTRGEVLGDYSVDITGAGRVEHSGPIRGKCSEDIVGSGSFVRD